MELCGKELRTNGKIVRIASLDVEGTNFWRIREAALRALRNSRTGVDLLPSFRGYPEPRRGTVTRRSGTTWQFYRSDVRSLVEDNRI